MAGAAAVPSNQPRAKVEARMAVVAGVWAVTSAKKDKLLELKTELKEGQRTLDDAATTDVERLDLYLADGLKCLVRAHEQKELLVVESSSSSSSKDNAAAVAVQDLLLWLEEESSSVLDKVSYEAYLTNVIRRADATVAKLDGSSLAWVRDFMERPSPSPPEQPNEDVEMIVAHTATDTDSSHSATQSAFDDSVQYYRSLLLKAAAETLLTAWDDITQISDGDLDRAAVLGETAPSVTTLSKAKLQRVLASYLRTTTTEISSSSLAAWWDLMDHDDDGLLEQDEVVRAVNLTRQPVERALVQLLHRALELRPATIADPADNDNADDTNTTALSWRQARQERRAQTTLRQILQHVVDTHFARELELSHRLRCTYAWADKRHQDGRTESVVVDTGATDSIGLLAGKKRYVELPPKMNLDEFRTEQLEHLPMLDSIGQETLDAFKSELHVRQGKQRQNKELRRDVAMFIGIITVLDVGIGLF